MATTKKTTTRRTTAASKKTEGDFPQGFRQWGVVHDVLNAGDIHTHWMHGADKQHFM